MFFRDVATNQLVGGNFEMYSSASKAIVWLGNTDDEERDQRIVFRQPAAVGTFEILASAIGAAFGSSGDAALVKHQFVMCDECHGMGWFEDADGERVDCPSCGGKGYGEDPKIARERRRRDRQDRHA
jgi:hypothetical protein